MEPELPGESVEPTPVSTPATHSTPPAPDDEDLAASLTALARLSMAQLGLEALLTEVATFAVMAIPGADGAGLTLLEAGRSDTIVKSEQFVREVDDIQYGIGEGPCISAAATGEVMRSGSLSSDPRWPRFGPRVGRLGVHSVLSLPLVTPQGVLGAMNVYAHPRDAFDDHAQRIGQLFAIPAAIAVQNAQILAQTKRLATNLHAAMTNRAVIDQAIGIVISRTGLTPEEAFQHIRARSQSEHIKVGNHRQPDRGNGRQTCACGPPASARRSVTRSQRRTGRPGGNWAPSPAAGSRRA